MSDKICSFIYVSLEKPKSGQKNLICAASNFYFLGPNIFLSNLFSNSLSPCSHLNGGDHFHTISKQKQGHNYTFGYFNFHVVGQQSGTQKFLK